MKASERLDHAVEDLLAAHAAFGRDVRQLVIRRQQPGRADRVRNLLGADLEVSLEAFVDGWDVAPSTYLVPGYAHLGFEAAVGEHANWMGMYFFERQFLPQAYDNRTLLLVRADGPVMVLDPELASPAEEEAADLAQLFSRSAEELRRGRWEFTEGWGYGEVLEPEPSPSPPDEFDVMLASITGSLVSDGRIVQQFTKTAKRERSGAAVERLASAIEQSSPERLGSLLMMLEELVPLNIDAALRAYRALPGSDPSLRRGLVSALGNVVKKRPAEIGPLLADAAQIPELRLQAVWGLAAYDQQAAIEAHLTQIRDAPDAPGRARAYGALGRNINLQASLAIPILEEGTADPDDRVRKHARDALDLARRAQQDRRR